MRLNEPKCCGECFYMSKLKNMPICSNPSFPKEMEVLDISAFKVDPSAIPKWCPIAITNKHLGELPKEKQAALDAVYNGLGVLFGWDVKQDG